MAQQPDEALLQASIDSKLFDRFTKQRDKFGMSNREFLTRMLDEALPRWEKAPAPSPVK
jgi:hypothetical protein